jgi:hypothetical protein
MAMNDWQKKLEEELSSFELRRPSEDLIKRIQADLEKHDKTDPVIITTHKSWWTKQWLAAAAAIMVTCGGAALLTKEWNPISTKTASRLTTAPGNELAADEPEHIYQPVDYSTEVVNCTTENSDDGKRVRLDLLDRVQYKSLDGKRTITVAQPRNEILLANSF